MKKENDSLIISRLGGTAQTARICGITSQAVSQWKSNGIPKPWRTCLKLMHPEVFEQGVRHHQKND